MICHVGYVRCLYRTCLRDMQRRSAAPPNYADPLVRSSQMNPAVSHLSLYDVANTKGVAADCSHINSRAQVQVRGVLSTVSRHARMRLDQCLLSAHLFSGL
eukprot:GHUV01044269.1.p1 GENE.GHUV01044269.1~~GHUV01044269.1.p1  ORF type:complete len:101 (-),score=1.55 GHUV01044269.1:112-414(-)